MNIVNSSPLVLFQISALVTLNACFVWQIKDSLDFKQGRMIPYEVMSRLLGNAMSALVLGICSGIVTQHAE